MIAIKERPILREGILFGIGIGIFQVILGFIASLVPPGVASWIAIIGFLLTLFVYMYVGFRITRETGALKKGAMAGALTGGIAYLVNGIVSLVATLVNLDAIRLATQATLKTPAQKAAITNQVIISSTLFTLLVLILFFGVIAGAVFAFFGGRLIDSRRRLAAMRSGRKT
ncbi:hypothetical protein KTT_28270 [Tengunoibacter tsumagoiensis]|uniref:DUF4199 domain-containing protein n=2 Tax=Tengunoibacter tsumagoiensis TaxID=2014871 RepID=A0A402A1E6_9CHLR|nr:hypothetical protein KTT_28270 [Tengunoibacter tsumagoiensis]